MSKVDSRVVRKEVLEKYGGKCAYCGCDLTLRTLQVDHINPIHRKSDDLELRRRGLIRGERYSISNFNPSCQSCNSSKSSASLESFRRSLNSKIKQLNRDSATYRIAKRYGLLKETGIDVSFYFERVEQCH